MQQTATTFDTMPVKIDELTTMLQSTQRELRELRELVGDYMKILRKDAKQEPEVLILGRFKRGELIYMSDKRLWSGEGAPFKSYQAVYYAMSKGCPFCGSKKAIKAEDLERWLIPNQIVKKLKL